MFKKILIANRGDDADAALFEKLGLVPLEGKEPARVDMATTE